MTIGQRTLTQTTRNYSLSKIGFHCPLWGTGTDSGYSYAAVELIKAWQALGIPVWANDTDAPVIFNMGQPHFYERVEGKLNIGYTAWESTEITKSWVQAMNRMDEIWAPCQANIDWYKAAGVTVPMRVLPHGINPKHWPIRENKALAEDEVYKFLHIGGDAPRKGALMVYDAFKNVFGEQEDVQLTLKGRHFNFNPKGNNINVLNELVSQDELREIYQSHHAMIYPTMGEGFGLVPFQAMATGMPTACTNWSGPRDFVPNYGFAIDVHYMTTPTYAPHIGRWAQPKYESVCNWMVRFYENRKKYHRLATMFARQLHEECTWEKIAETALEFMSESLV